MSEKQDRSIIREGFQDGRTAKVYRITVTKRRTARKSFAVVNKIGHDKTSVKRVDSGHFPTIMERSNRIAEDISRTIVNKIGSLSQSGEMDAEGVLSILLQGIDDLKGAGLIPQSDAVEANAQTGRLSNARRNKDVAQSERSHSIPTEPLRDKQGKRILWATHKVEESGKPDTPPAFIKRNYGNMLGKGLTRADLNQLDPQLYTALYHWLKKNDLPEGFDLPTKSRALASDANGPTLDEVREARRILGRWTTRQAARERAGKEELTK